MSLGVVFKLVISLFDLKYCSILVSFNAMMALPIFFPSSFGYTGVRQVLFNCFDFCFGVASDVDLVDFTAVCSGWISSSPAEFDNKSFELRFCFISLSSSGAEFFCSDFLYCVRDVTAHSGAAYPGALTLSQ